MTGSGAAQAAARWTDLDGPVRYLDFGGPADGPLIVCVHGLGGSAANWLAIAPLLTDRYRLLALDLAGHGLTRAGNRGTDVAANCRLLHRFITDQSASPVILIGNSMGGMISLLEAGTAASMVAGLILLDPALPFVPARVHPLAPAMFALSGTPGISRIFAAGRRRMSPQAMVAGILAFCCADPRNVPADVVAAHVELASQRADLGDTAREFGVAVRSVVSTAGPGGRSYRRAIAAVRCPTLLVHGAQDRIVPVAAARAIARKHPEWSLVVLPGVGHVPQLEAAAATAGVITAWLGSAGLADCHQMARRSGQNGPTGCCSPAHAGQTGYGKRMGQP
jgi:pimeloyl-ACP methyl ester carboxylesterase